MEEATTALETATNPRHHPQDQVLVRHRGSNVGVRHAVSGQSVQRSIFTTFPCRKWKERTLAQFKAGGPRSLTRETHEQDLKTLRGLKLHAYSKAAKAAHPAPLQREEEDTDSGGEG